MPIFDGATFSTFVVRLSKPATEPVTVGWKTEPGTAFPGQDYEEAEGELTFLPGQVEKSVQILVYGREAGDDEARTFRIAILPSPNVVLGQAATDLIITVNDDDDAPVATATFAKGMEGLSAYEIAQLQGFTGTPAEWMAHLREPSESAAGAATAAAAYAQEQGAYAKEKADQIAQIDVPEILTARDEALAARDDAVEASNGIRPYTEDRDGPTTYGVLVGQNGRGFTVDLDTGQPIVRAVRVSPDYSRDTGSPYVGLLGSRDGGIVFGYNTLTQLALVPTIGRRVALDRDTGSSLTPLMSGRNARATLAWDEVFQAFATAPFLRRLSTDRDGGAMVPVIADRNRRTPLAYDEVENAVDIRLNRSARARVEYHSPSEFIGPHRAFNVRLGKNLRFATVQESDGYISDVRQRIVGGSTMAIADTGDNIVELVQFTGQSNAGPGSIVGRDYEGIPAPRHLIRTDGSYAYGDDAVPASPAATDFQPMPEPPYGGAQGQTPSALLAIAAYDLGRRDASRPMRPIAVTTNWRGSDQLDSFFPGTPSRFNHENVLEQARRVRAVARLYGCTIQHDIFQVHGEAGAVGDYYATENTYLDTVVPLYGGNKGSGDAAYKVFIFQTNSPSAGSAYDLPALAQLRIARERFAAGVTTLASVMYDGPLEDQGGADIHGSARGRMIVHERAALARSLVRSGTPFHPTWPVAGGMTAAGNVVTVPISLATGSIALAIDTDRVAPVPNFGFVWNRGGGGGPTISNVAISGTNILVTLSGPPTSGDTLRYALDNTAPLEGWAGGRGQIYATTTTASPFAARGFNVPATIRQPLVRFEEIFP